MGLYIVFVNSGAVELPLDHTVHFRAKRTFTCHEGSILAAFRSL